ERGLVVRARSGNDVQVVFDLLDLHGLDRRSRGSLSLAGHNHGPAPTPINVPSSHPRFMTASKRLQVTTPRIRIRDSGFGTRGYNSTTKIAKDLRGLRVS